MDNEIKPKRGLMALLANTSQQAPPPSAPVNQATAGTATLSDLPINSIRPNPNQPRTTFEPAALHELAASIKAQGVIQPIVVRPLKPEERHDAHEYELIAGERRWRASQAAGLKSIPAVVKPVWQERDILLLSLVENLQRDDLDPIEEAVAYERLIKAFNLTQDQVAEGVGKSRSTVTNMLRVLELPQTVQDAIKKRELSLGHAKALLTVPDPKLQAQLAAKVQGESLTVRALERLIAADKEPTRKSGALGRPSRVMTRKYVSADHQEIEQRLRERFGTRVRVEDGATAGRIVVEFYSVEDFHRITQLMGLE